MAKRFTDTEKWKKVWFSELSPVQKCFWSYILDSCSSGGIWEVNWRLASFNVGAKLNPGTIVTVFEKQFIPLDGGRKWFIVDFIPFQYRHLSPNNSAHKGALEELRRYSLVAPDCSIILPDNNIRAPLKELQSPSAGAKDKDKDMDKDMAKAMATDTENGKRSFGEFGNVLLTDKEHEKLTAKLGADRAPRAIEILSAYKQSTGKRYVSDYATFSTWVIGELEKRENGNGTSHRAGNGQGREVITTETIHRLVKPPSRAAG